MWYTECTKQLWTFKISYPWYTRAYVRTAFPEWIFMKLINVQLYYADLLC